MEKSSLKSPSLLIGVTFLFSLTILQAQSIVFTTKNTAGDDAFWKANVGTPFAYESITEGINKKAKYAGKHKGPISISHNGAFYVFQSERFDNNIDGYEAITLFSSDLETFEVPKDASGAAFHSEGIMQVSNDGKTIYFVQGGGTHDRDVYKITKGASSWSSPTELSSAAAFKYNIAPYLAYDESTLLMEGSNLVDHTTNILEVSNSGSNLKTIISLAGLAGSKQIKSPSYDSDGNIYFEAETDAERVWKTNASGATPAAVKASFTNDNSPVTLPGGKIASLYLPASTHQIKVMNGNGLNDVMITKSSNLFDEVLDIGISGGGAAGSSLRIGSRKNISLKSLLLQPTRNTNVNMLILGNRNYRFNLSGNIHLGLHAK